MSLRIPTETPKPVFGDRSSSETFVLKLSMLTDTFTSITYINQFDQSVRNRKPDKNIKELFYNLISSYFNRSI